MKSEGIGKRSSFGSIMKRRLSDITNLQSQPKIFNHEEKPSKVPTSEDIIKQLIQEKMTLVKLLEERNKIIELTGTELQNLKIQLQKLQLQNWNLAQSNSQFLAELNLGRAKLKSLQHELVCKDALIKVKNMEKEEREEVTGQCLPNAYDNEKTTGRGRRRATSKSMGPSTSNRQAAEKEKVENKRRCMRRQSARFKSHEREITDNLFEIEETKFPVTLPLNDDHPMHEDGRGGSSDRPVRRAAQKIQSYKEIPVNVKMRRPQ